MEKKGKYEVEQSGQSKRWNVSADTEAEKGLEEKTFQDD